MWYDVLSMCHFLLCMFLPVPRSPGWFGGSPPNRVDLSLRANTYRESEKAYLVMYVCMHACMHACMRMCIYIYTDIDIGRKKLDFVVLMHH